MATATVSVFQQLQQIEDLRRQAESQYKDYQKALTSVNKTLAQLAEVASKANVGIAGVPLMPITPSKTAKALKATPPTTGAKRRGRPRKSEAAVTTPVTVGAKRRGRPKKVVAANEVKVATQRHYDNPKSLRETCWEILDRDPSSYRKILSEYPEGAKGLKVTELKEIIETEGVWTSSSADIGAQIQNTLHNLRNKEGKLHRNDEDRRYTIVSGKQLND